MSAGRRSRTGCLECRRRKIKCSEDRPICAQCRRAARTCVPHAGITFRHQQNASISPNDESGQASLGSFYSYRNAFSKDSVWVDIPKQLQFVALNVADILAEADDVFNEASASVTTTPLRPAIGAPRSGPGTHGAAPASLSAHAAPGSVHRLDAARGLEALSAAAASGDRGNYTSALSTPNLTSMPPTPTSGLGPTSAKLQNPHRSHTSRSSSSLPSPFGANFSPVSMPLPSDLMPLPSPDKVSGSSVRLISDAEYEEDRETTFLLRHFSEGPGRWMDLFDIAMFFSHHLPKEARHSAVLRHAAAAVAAKQLMRVKGRKLPIDGASEQPPQYNYYPGAEKTDWGYQAAQHYDKAVELLRKAVADKWLNRRRYQAVNQSTPSSSRYGGNLASINSRSTDLSPGLSGLDDLEKRRKIESEADFVGSDELAAATAILCVYEFMDGSNNEWSSHLDGTKSLLDLAERNMMSLHVSVQLPISKARKSTFWNFARQDFLSALINGTQTRLDTEDLPFWKDAGLLLDSEGYVQPAIARNSWLPEDDNIAKEDMLSNSLVWLMAKLVNYAIAADSPPKTGAVYPSYLGVDQITLHERWSEICKQIEVWHEGLPVSFKASYVRAPAPHRQAHVTDEEGDVFGEQWYAKPMCGSTMMTYAWARILLLINMPQHSTLRNTTVFRRFRSYTTTTTEMLRLAREICAIAMSRPEAAVRVNSVQPLFFAGQVLEDPLERRIIIRLLREIERDTGWATEYRVTQLQEYWAEPV